MPACQRRDNPAFLASRPGETAPAAPARPVISDLRVCLAFFSRLPVGRLPGDASPARSVRALPLAGALIGCFPALALSLAAAAGLPPGVAATLAVATGLAVTGGLHEDGLADTADGFGGGATRERKLAIMRDSRIGSYGVLALAVVLALRGGALAALIGGRGPAAAGAATAAAAALSRALALLPMSTLPPARADGLARGFGRPSPAALWAAAVLAAVLALGLPVLAGLGAGHALLAAGVAGAAAALLTRLAAQQIGGHTGDVAGAAQQVAEAAFLVGLLAFP